MRYTRLWTEWLAHGREQYLQQTQAQNAQYQNQLQQFQKEKSKHDQEVKEAQDRFRELQQNEEWKAKHCRLCPNCGRVIQKLDGCDSMMCGQDAHGGNAQNGCGRPFNWSSAKRYVADSGEHKMVVELNVLPPDQVQRTKYPIIRMSPCVCVVRWM
jgi:hypothetical protein